MPSSYFAAALMLAGAAQADTMHNCSAAWSEMSAADKSSTSYAQYSKMCLSADYRVPATSNAIPAGATGKCNDGTYTTVTVHAGACSRHGGVANWMPGH